MRIRTRAIVSSALMGISSIASVSMPLVAHAQGTVAPSSVEFNLPAQPLARALSAIAEQANIQVVYPDKEPLSIQAPAIKGRMTVNQALATALNGSGYDVRWLRDGVVTLIKVNAGDGEKVIGAVSVEGVQGSPYFGGAGQMAGVNGINGSKDITATEGTGSFTSGALTVGSKIPQALKDVPASISILTSEQLKQQNVTDFTEALRQLPGVSMRQGNSNLENVFYSRGFAIESIQIDGGAPLSTTFFNQSSALGTSSFFPQIDLSLYDHVELFRGADGTFNGYGDPSGSVNLVRKKPLDHGQYGLEVQGGSWQTYRVSADATSPLAFDGALRGRTVLTWQSNHHFYDIAKDDKSIVYGILDFDISPTTLITAGGSYTKQNSVPFYNGLPRYITGDDLNLPRSTCLCFPWNRSELETTEFFGSLEQKIGESWLFKINVTNNKQTNKSKLGYSTGFINNRDDAPVKNAGAKFYTSYNDYSSKQLSTEATLTGAFEILGQRQEITFGASRVDTDGSGRKFYQDPLASPYTPYPGGPTFSFTSPNGLRPPIDVFNFDPNNPLYKEPATPLANGYSKKSGQVQTLAYANARLTAFDWLHLNIGIRWSQSDEKYIGYAICTAIPPANTVLPPNVDIANTCINRKIGDFYKRSDKSFKDSHFSWPPTINLSADVTKNLTAYVGYSDIYKNQANYLDEDLNPLDPITGSNWETGLKWQSPNGRFNASISAFSQQQKNFAKLNGTRVGPTTIAEILSGVAFYIVTPNGRRVVNGLTDPAHNCCYVTDPDQTLGSKGIDLQIAGEVMKGWQISASYTYNKTKQTGAVFQANNGLPFVTIQPEHNYKLWTSYSFGEAGNSGWLSKLIISGGLNGQSKGYYSGSACNRPGPPDTLGNSNCDYTASPVTVPYEFSVNPYTVFSGRIDYSLSDKWSLALNIENILDKNYYSSVGSSPEAGNWYGSPRNFTVILNGKW